MFHADATAFAAAFAVLYAVHEVGDHWIQTDYQAITKGRPDWAGRLACAGHVVVLALVKASMVGLVAVVLALPLKPCAVIMSLAVDAVSHYWADRRRTLAALAERLGKGNFARLGDGLVAPAGTGAYALDQSWHVGWLLVAALGCCVGAAP
ncbi:DUF3307 domain-containing protein [Actinomadura graeca]|uniref:DUF3307 domain-containing protein n=1 Tax=Actinomadura graeca TaxID=2750812 RepID=A0ABX8R559_9ACTN|nr:DUF3307 domain-containing protein [Actinomadura graeca]QXJ25983.1 DUF3307 domain-containing protein [Actinomadura graeca]